MRRTILLALAVIGVLTPAPALARVPVQVTREVVGRPIPAGFLGLSTEFGSLYAYAGQDPRGVNPVFVRLIENLADGSPAVLRIGGDSTDRTWWPVRGMTKPPWASYGLSPRWASVARALAAALGTRLVLGINLLADSRSIASAVAQALIAGIGRREIAAFEIGNEPELYSTEPWYWTASGRPVLGRAGSFSFAAYLREVARLRTALPRVPLAGPATGSLGWLSHLPALLTREPGLRDVTFHRYPLNRCIRDPRSLSYPSVSRLLSVGSSEGLVGGVARAAALAHRHGVSFHVDELNSVTCGGKAGVSDTFASALWGLDTAFSMARSGVDSVEVHIHPEAPANQLFTFTRPGGRWAASVRPLYYGLLMFAQAAPAGARLLRVSAPAPGALRSWATLGRDGKVRVVLINDSLTRAASVLVRLPGGAGVAALERLLAPSAYATAGVTFGGQGVGAFTGTLRGPPGIESLRPRDGEYSVAMPAASAALITVPGIR